MTEPTPEEMRQELAELRRRIGEVRAERLAAQRVAASGVTVRRAAEAAARDRDALTTDELERLRTRTEDLTHRLQTAWRHVDQQRAHAARLMAVGLDLAADAGLAPGAELLQAFEAEADLRVQVRRRFDETGVVTVRVPRPVTLALPQHQHREELAEILAQVAQQAAEREAAERQTSRRRAPDPHRGTNRGSR